MTEESGKSFPPSTPAIPAQNLKLSLSKLKYILQQKREAEMFSPMTNVTDKSRDNESRKPQKVNLLGPQNL